MHIVPRSEDPLEYAVGILDDQYTYITGAEA